MSKKKRKSKNCNVRRLRRLATTFSADLGIAQINEEKCHLVDLRRNRKHPSPSKSLISLFTDHPHKWSILLACFCVNGSERYVKTEQINLAAPYYQSDLLEFLKEAHGELARQCNQSHLSGLGWIASTSNVDFDVEQAELLLDELGAWDDL